MKNNFSTTHPSQRRVYLRRCLLLLIVVLACLLAFENWKTVNAAPGPVTGSVWHDVNGNGVKDAGEGAFSSLAILNLYNSSGSYVKSRTSDSSGNFSLSGLSAGTYYVSVFNTTRPALLTGPPGLINDVNVQVEQTYGSVGAGAGSGSGPVCVSAAPNYTARTNYTSTPGEWTVGTQNGTNAGPCFGGRKADMTNTVTAPTLPLTYSQNQDVTTTNPALNTQKTVSKVIVTNDGGVSNVDFGLSANTVTNTSASGQGSLNQFITNANSIGGARAMRFTPSVATNQGGGSNAWWQINQGNNPLPTISNTGTILDGRAWSNTDGSTQLNTNVGALGGASVGTTQYSISGIQKPELELVGNTRASGLTPLVQVTGSNVTIANFGLNSTVNYPSTESYFIQQTSGSGSSVNNNVMGVNIASGSNYSTRPQTALSTAFLLSLNNTGTYKHNYISSNDARGMSLTNVNSLVLGDWVIEENDGPSAGVSFGTATVRIMVRHNNMPTAWLDASLLITSLGLHTLTENTISGGSGVVTIAGLQNTITKNVITNATGSNPGISVGGLSTGNYISQNSFSGNGGNAIDLNADGVSANTLGCLTQVTGLINLANTGIARPSITNARLNGNTLTFDVGYCALGIFNVEVYKAAAGSGDSNAGEGASYLGTLTNLSLINGALTNQSLTVSGVNPGDSISAIVVDAVLGNTSEFGPNTTALSPPSVPTNAPDMTSSTDSGASNTDNITSNATPSFSGSCTDGETVTLYIDGSAITPTHVCSGGMYTITPSTAISQGARTITATFTNGSGESTPGPSLNFTIDTTAPSTPGAPDLTSATDSGASNTDNITNATTPTFSGSCTDGETVTLYVDNALSASQICSGSSYSLQPSSSLAQGAHNLTVTSTDIAGNQSSQSLSLSVTIDTTAPGAPTINSPVNGGAINSATPTISGSGETGATVTVRDSSNSVLCTAIVVSGSWSCAPSSTLPEGSLSLTATQTDIAGNISPNSSTTTTTVDTTAPGAPVITSPTSGSVTNDNTPTISGTAAANASVSLTISGHSPVTVTADSSGNWSYAPSGSLDDGTYSVSATQIDAAGNVSPASNSINLSIDTVRPSVTVNKADDQPDPTTDASARFTVVFSEQIASGSFGPSDITIGSSPPTNDPQVTSLTQQNSTTWQVIITNIPNHTTISANLAANAITDLAGNGNTASTSTDNSVLYEVNAPNITKQITNDTTPSLDGECVTTHNLQLDLQGPTTRSYTTSCTNNQWTFTVPTGLPDGTYNVIVTDTTVGSLTNTPTNQNAALIIDTVRPSVTVSRSGGQASPTNINSASFTITFSETVDPASFTASDLNLTGTSSGQLNLTQQSSTVWQAVVTSMTSGDTAILTLPSNRVADLTGNLNTVSVDTNNSVSYDATPPSAPVITSPSDGTTINDNTPLISGSGETGAVVTVLVDDATITCQEGAVIVSSGTWSCTPTITLGEGEHELTARQTDTADNQSVLSNTITVTLDSTPPSQLSTPDLTNASDSGINNTDNITSDTTPTFTGSCTTDDTIRVFSDGNLIASGSCSSSTYNLTTSQALTEGQHSITATATDGANNTSVVSPSLIITIDTAAPNVPTISSPTDGSLLNTSTPIINGGGENDAVIVVSVDGHPITCQEGTITVANNGWNCTPNVALSDGAHTITAHQTDPAGNQSSETTAVNITIDTTAPTTLGTPDLVASSDSGTSNTDNITSDTTSTFIGSCVSGDTITLFGNAGQVASGSCVSGSYNLTASPALTDGSYAITATATDPAGNISSVSTALNITIDSAAPAQLSTPDLIAASDTGGSNTDNITNDNTPSFNDSCTSGTVVQLLIDGSLVAQGTCSAGSYSLTPSSIVADGAHTITVIAVDTAGNQSTVSNGLNATIDTTIPATPVIISPADGSLLNTNTPLISGSGETDLTVTIQVDGNPITCQEGIITVLSSAWSCTPSVVLSEGEHDITARQTDTAGNISTAATARTVTIDTTPPDSLDAPDLASSSDTGTSNTDNITGDRTPTLLGDCEDGDTITLLVDGQNIQPPMTVTCNNSGYSFTFSSNLPGGTYNFSVTATDPANNTSTVSPSLAVTIVTSGPTAPEAPDLDASSDSGFSDSDNITNQTMPSFHGSCHGAPSATLYIDGLVVASGSCVNDSYELTGTTLLNDGEHHATASLTDSAGIEGNQSPTLLIMVDVTAPAPPDLTSHQDGQTGNDSTPTIGGEHEEDGTHIQVPINGGEIDCEESARVLTTNGTWQCTVADPLPDGNHDVSSHATDPAGNQSDPSDPISLGVDTTPPNPPAAPDLLAADDSGASNSDNLTNNTSPRFTGSCQTGDTVRLHFDGNLVGSGVCVSSSYQLTPSGPLVDANYAATVITVDPANNSSTASTALNITIDTTAPSAPSTPDLTTDTGSSSTDNITNVDTPSFSGSCISGSVVRLYIDSNLAAQGNCTGGSYNLTVSPALSSGNHTATVTQTDPAGNASGNSSALPLTIDINAPGAPIITAPTNGTTTSQNQPVITGQGETNASVTILVDGAPISCSEGAVVVSSGTWQCTLSSPLSDGEYNLTARQTDLAGNQSTPSNPNTITLDTAPPAAPGTPDLLASSDSGSSDSDNITNDTTPSFSGTCLDGTSITLYAGSTAVASGDCSGGNYNLTASPALVAGNYSFTTTASNQSNIIGPASSPLTVTIETAGPAAPGTPDLTAATDSGRSNSDNISNDRLAHFSGACVTGASLQLRVNGSMVGQGICTSSSYELVPSSQLSEGNLLITVTAVSTAGNISSASNSLAVAIDATAPGLPVISVPHTGMQTNNNKPTMSGMGETNAWLNLSANSTPITCTQASPLEVTGGVWTCTPTSSLTDGQWNIAATQTDTAGNTSAQTAPISMSVDTVAPTRLGRPDLTAATDSGSSNTDNLTNITMPVLVGTCVNGDTVRLRQNSVVIAQVICSGSNYSLSPPANLSDGVYGFSATATDSVGNTSSVSLTLNVTIRTVAAQPAMPGLHPDSDSGVSTSDGVTRITLPTLTGPCTADETVRVYIDGVLHRTVVCASPFLAQPLSHLTPGNHNVTISVTDLAGNISGMSPVYAFTIDTIAPGNPVVTTPANGSTPTVTSTSYTTIGTGEANAWINVWEGGVNKCTAIIDGNGNWNCTLTNLANGNHSYVFSVSDRAGNPGAQIITRNIFVNHP